MFNIQRPDGFAMINSYCFFSGSQILKIEH